MALFGKRITSALIALRGGSPIDNPAIPLSSSAIWDWLVGGEATVAGEQINEANSLQITTVYSCITLLASMGATLPLRLMERTDKGHVVAEDTGLHYLLNSEPNPEMSAPSFVETMIGCLAMGNCYAQIERNKLRQAVALWPLNPLKTEPVRQPSGVMAYKTSQGEPLGTYRIVDAKDMIHVPLFSLEGRKGMSPIMLARQSLGLAKAAEKHGARLFGNGTKGTGVFMNKAPKPSPAVQKEMKESWQENAGGVNQGRMQFLWGGDWSYQSLGLTPEESQFLATRSFQRADIAARAFDPRITQVRAGFIKIGVGDGDVFLAAALDGFVVALLRRFENRFSPLLRGRCQVALLRRNLVLDKKLLGALVIDLLLVQIGLGILHGLLRRLHFLLTCSGQREREARIAHTHRSFVDAHPLFIVGVVEPSEQRALLHLLALLDGQINYASRHLEAHQALMRLNVS